MVNMKKRYHHLVFMQRCEIAAMYRRQYSQKEIAMTLKIHPSRVCRELRRNSDKVYGYDSMLANISSQDRHRRKCKAIKLNDKLKKYIKEKLLLKWSPEQISGYAKRHNIFSISHESIYQFIAEDKKNSGELYKNLRHGNKRYRGKYGSGKRHNIIKDKICIDQRPEIINNKKRLGDWEIDTVLGYDRSQAIVTITERLSKKLVAQKIPNHGAFITARATISSLNQYKAFVHSITGDNGIEFAQHKMISEALKAIFYFAHPYSSWERGLNENTNGLLRQYLPKKTDFNSINDDQLANIVEEINNRPRKTLQYQTPKRRGLSGSLCKFENK
jgi:IS30 family transposase